MGTDALLRPHQLTLPLLPIWGHTVTAPMRHREAGITSGPRAAVTDALHQVTINRLGQRLRITGGMEYGAMRSDQQQPAQERLYKALDDWFPGAAQMSQVQWWKGASPTLADGQPLLGPSGLDGIWLNIGHGRNGWTLACGSARLMAEMLGRQAPSIDIEGLGLERFRS
jgi:D-amino-acid dehydrogenase